MVRSQGSIRGGVWLRAECDKEGDIIEIGLDIVKFGKTSITMKCEVRNVMTKAVIITVEAITMVNLDSFGQPAVHGKTSPEE